MIYDFSKQAKMLGYALDALRETNVDEYALGGGTALSAYYWEHRFSTDIDIFINGQNTLNELKKHFKRLKISEDIRFPGHYLEIFISENQKIQFFETRQRTKSPIAHANLWGFDDIRIESIDEILAKKIYFRANKGNTRDIFDIALGVHKNSKLIKECLSCGAISQSNVLELKNMLETIENSSELKSIYQDEIDLIIPNPKYNFFALNAVSFLLKQLS